jgi:hypothetical protein
MFEQSWKVSVDSGTTVDDRIDRINVREQRPCGAQEGEAMNAGTLEAARLRHPAGSRLSGCSAPVGAPDLRLVPPMARQRGASEFDGVGGGERGPRLTRRGRAVALALLLAVVFGAGLAFGTRAVGADSRSAVPAVPHSLIVRPGQTLWGIARAVDPGADPRSTVDRLIELNALPGADIEAGRTLVIP